LSSKPTLLLEWMSNLEDAAIGEDQERRSEACKEITSIRLELAARILSQPSMMTKKTWGYAACQRAPPPTPIHPEAS